MQSVQLLMVSFWFCWCAYLSRTLWLWYGFSSDIDPSSFRHNELPIVRPVVSIFNNKLTSVLEKFIFYYKNHTQKHTHTHTHTHVHVGWNTLWVQSFDGINIKQHKIYSLGAEHLYRYSKYFSTFIPGGNTNYKNIPN